MTVKIEGAKDISCIVEKLQGLEYDVVLLNNKTAFAYRKGSSLTSLSNDMKSAKEACKFIGQLKLEYGYGSKTA